METPKSVNNFDIKMTSWNVRGIRKLIKPKQVINRLRHLKSKIVFLQETHFQASDISCLEKRWPGQVIYASYNNNARGVVILVHKSVPFQVTKQFKIQLEDILLRKEIFDHIK